MLCMSERTLQCRRSELGLPIVQSLLYSQLGDEELDEVVSNILQVETGVNFGDDYLLK